MRASVFIMSGWIEWAAKRWFSLYYVTTLLILPKFFITLDAIQLAWHGMSWHGFDGILADISAAYIRYIQRISNLPPLSVFGKCECHWRLELFSFLLLTVFLWSVADIDDDNEHQTTETNNISKKLRIRRARGYGSKDFHVPIGSNMSSFILVKLARMVYSYFVPLPLRMVFTSFNSKFCMQNVC